MATKTSSAKPATTRKKRTIARLRREKVPVLPSLPRVEDEREVKLRTRDAIVDRAIALLAVAGKGIHAPAPLLAQYRREFAVAPKLSPKEQAFWKKAKPTAREFATFSWRYEALCLLLWSLGFIPKLTRPSKQADPAKLGGILLDRGPRKFRREAKRRPAKQILDMADLMYRYHWAVRDAQLNGKPPPSGLNPDIVMEWDHAVRWLVTYSDQDWDDITLDT